jgi:hypothetical protein
MGMHVDLRLFISEALVSIDASFRCKKQLTLAMNRYRNQTQREYTNGTDRLWPGVKVAH